MYFAPVFIIQNAAFFLRKSFTEMQKKNYDNTFLFHKISVNKKRNTGDENDKRNIEKKKNTVQKSTFVYKET